MALERVTGIVSGLRERSEISGGRNHIRQKITASFRVGNRPVSIDMAANIGDGDHVTAVGDDKAELRILVLRNDTTSVTYWPYPPTTSLIASCAVIVLSIPLMMVLIGFLLLPAGIYGVWKTMQIRKATALLG